MGLKVKFIQISASDGKLFALDMRGKIWFRSIHIPTNQWVLLESPEDTDETN